MPASETDLGQPLLILDCDGVLVDSEPIAVRLHAEILAQLGWPISEEEIARRFVGRSHDFMATAVRRRLGERAIAWERNFRTRLRASFDRELKPVDGVIEALSQLSARTCVASSGSHDKIGHSLRVCGLYERFEGRIFSSDDVVRGKPAPDLFLHAAKQMGADPRACLVVEDTEHGVRAARAAGMFALAYAGGLIPVEWLSGSRTIVFWNMRQLPFLVDIAISQPSAIDPAQTESG